MFVQIFRSTTLYVVVNVNHIVFLEPNGQEGCTVKLSTGDSFYAVESYETIMENINNAIK